MFIATPDAEMAEKAKSIVLSIVEDAKVGAEYQGPVVKVLEFGAFVSIAPNKDGMIHISRLSDKRVRKVTDVIDVGDEVKVQVIKVDEKGRIDLKLLEIIDKK